jgi:7,8-dihydroneopterin aldolase/epimerase/oxygenase
MTEPTPDLIELRGLRAVGICGALPFERVAPQPFEVDLDVEVDLAEAGASDQLGDTVDYGQLSEAVTAVITDEQPVLLERMASRIAEVVLGQPRVTAVTVVVRKLRPPVPVELATSGVRIRRTR